MVTVHIPWSSKVNTSAVWSEITVSILEHFGLPGGKYTTELNEHFMNFNFYHEHDALMCKLLVSDYI